MFLNLFYPMTCSKNEICMSCYRKNIGSCWKIGVPGTPAAPDPASPPEGLKE